VAEKLTKAQRAMLELAAEPAFRICGLSLYGGREFRTAKSLERRGFASVSVTDKAFITPAGCTALQEQNNGG
jgi:hypothetical protein